MIKLEYRDGAKEEITTFLNELVEGKWDKVIYSHDIMMGCFFDKARLHIEMENGHSILEGFENLIHESIEYTKSQIPDLSEKEFVEQCELKDTDNNDLAKLKLLVHNSGFEFFEKTVRLMRGVRMIYVEDKPDLVGEMIEEIISDIEDRRGIKSELAKIDEDIKEEIKDNWRAIIESKMNKQ